MHEGLDFRIRIPLLAVYFVAANVEELVGEETGHLADEFIEKPVSLFPGRVHGGIEDSPLALNFVRSGPAGQFGIPGEPRRTVAWHVELRHHADTTLLCIRDHAADFGLGVEEPVRTHFMQLREYPALDAEALVLGKMPVKYVQLDRGHAVQVALDYIHRDEVAAGVNHQPPPGKARTVLDGNGRRGEACACGGDQLQKSLQPAHDTQAVRSAQPGAAVADLEPV